MDQNPVLVGMVHKHIYVNILVGGFKYFVYFHPYLGK